MVETILRVDGMMCGMCESHINDVLIGSVGCQKCRYELSGISASNVV